MMRFLVLSVLFASLVFGTFQIAGASGPACFNYGKTKDLDRVCIVTKIEGSRMCMVEFYVPTKTRGQYEVCEFIRDRGNAAVGDQIIVEAEEFKNDRIGKCYKAPGCGKAVVVGGGSKQGSVASPAPVPATQQKTSSTTSAKKGSSQVAYTTVDAICADGARSTGKVAEISDLFMKDCSPDGINFQGKKTWCNNKINNIALSAPKALADKLKPYEFQRNITLRFKVVKIWENNYVYKGGIHQYWNSAGISGVGRITANSRSNPATAGYSFSSAASIAGRRSGTATRRPNRFSASTASAASAADSTGAAAAGTPAAGNTDNR